MKILVTSALPYANGDIHLGHLAGCYLPADIYVRYQKLNQRDIIFICGTDEHGVPITIAADQQKKSPKEIVDKYYKSIKDSFTKFGIEFTNFSRTSIPLHHKTSRDFFTKIFEKGHIYPKSTKQFYCHNCKMFLADRYVVGICPHCGKEGARGDQCESCGRWLEPFLLIEAKCKTCGGTPETKETTHWFFALSRFQKKLEAWISEKTEWKDNVKRFCEGWFSQGLEDRAITRDLTWGVKVPLKEAEGKVMYVWFDAPIGYISSTMEWSQKIGKPDRWKEYWLDHKTKMVHFIGKDNIVFHAIVWPAMLMAHSEYLLPSEIPANEFLNLEGRKLSTSENWAVWLPEYLEEFEPDPLRYALAANLPENRDIDFTWFDFWSRNNNELADVLGNFVNRVAQFIKNNYNGRIPKATDYRNEDQEILKAIETTTQSLGEMIDKFQIKDALRLVMTLPAMGNRYFDYQAPWKSFKENKANCDKTINVCTKLISSLEILLQPFIPFTTNKIRAMLGFDTRTWAEAKNPALPDELKKIEVLFPKIEKAKIDAQVAKLGKKPKKVDPALHRLLAEKKGGTEETEKKMTITIEDFKKLELKVAKIIAAEKVAGTDKLVKMNIDLGTEKRQIVAGIGMVYPPESLVGKTIIIVANLAPTKIRGVESNGMLLAAVEGGNISVVTLDKELSPGSQVS